MTIQTYSAAWLWHRAKSGRLARRQGHPTNATFRSATDSVEGSAGQLALESGMSVRANILAPLKAARKKCLRCCKQQRQEIELCPADNCPLHPLRFGHAPAGWGRTDTREALAARCRDCAGGAQVQINACGIFDCPLYEFRPSHPRQRAARRRHVLPGNRTGERRVMRHKDRERRNSHSGGASWVI